MIFNTDQTVNRCVALVKASAQRSVLEGVVWYDTTNEGLEAELKILRCCGEVAHHPVIHTLVRFNQDKR